MASVSCYEKTEACSCLLSFVYHSPTGTFQDKGTPSLCLGSEAQPVFPTKPFPIFQRLSADVNQPSEKADELTRLITLTSLSDLVHVGGKPPKALPVVLTLPMLLLSTSHLLPLWLPLSFLMRVHSYFSFAKVAQASFVKYQSHSSLSLLKFSSSLPHFLLNG